MTTATSAVLELDHLSVSYQTDAGLLDTVRDVSLRVGPHEKYGLVGESGSGKTTLALGVMRYLPRNGRITGGRALFDGVELLTLSDAEMRRIWGRKIGMVYQNPSTALNPALTIGSQIAEVAKTHLDLSRADAWNKAIEMFEKVRMPDPVAVARRYPHQLSGGMLQRALIAMSLTCNPRLLILDEPTTSLDVTTEAVVLDLIKGLAEEYHSAILYITHNLGVVASLCDRVGVLYAGELVEEAPLRDLFYRPLHPYTLGLIGCVPRVDADKYQIELNTIPGFIPRPDELPDGCIFAPRCILAEEACSLERPPLTEVAPGRLSACRRWEETGQQRSASARVRQSGGDKPELSAQPLLDTVGVKKHFKADGLRLPFMPGGSGPRVKAVDGIDLAVPPGSTLGLVGESGSGKTTFGRCIVGLIEPSSGEVRLGNTRLAAAVARRPRSTLKRLQMVFQNPDASLNPRMTVGGIIGRPLLRLARVSSRELEERVAKLLEAVKLPESYRHRLPGELSGGEKQRVAIARAFAAEPELVICDEPLSALDVSVQGSLINLLADLQRSQRTAYLFISHDLAAVRHLSDLVAVVYLGRLCEMGASSAVFTPPYHPYTEALLSAIPVPDPEAPRKRIRLEGGVPSAIDIPPGCRFHTRCPRKIGPVCEREEPPWWDVSPTHHICCHFDPGELASLQDAQNSASLP